ncbi:MAG: InlB B-repeat-containing protein, partial [Clostridia bacterium]|nr:InlB B-repeat-containing protein [Clostridia bacterium]
MVSKIDSEIVEKATQERSNLLLALKRRIKKMWLIRGGAMAASFLLVATTVLLVVLFAKEVPVYTGMTVSNAAPTTVASVTLPSYLDPGNGNGNAYGNKHLAGDHTDADKTIGDKPFPKPIGDAVGAFNVQSAEPRYYAKPNEDVYITVHIDNPDNFVILSFTLNGKMYSSYMFEEGSDLENLILKVNVGDVEGMVSYTIDAIKYVDGTKIKDVKIGGERTVEIGVYTEKQPAAAFSDLVLGFNSISFAVDVSDTKNLFESLTGDVEAVLYDGEQIVARKNISAMGKTTVTFDGLTTGALYECAIIATYDALDGEGIARHVLSTHAAYTKSIVLFDEVEIGTTTLLYQFLWDQAFAAKTVTGLALYQNDTKVRDIDVSATTVGDLVPGATYTLVATYRNGSADEQIRITFTTDALFVTVNQYLEALDGTYTLLETVTETVAQGTVYTPTLGSHVGFTTPTVEPMTMTDRSHVFECYFERTAYEVTFHYNSAQGITTESIKFGKPLAPSVTPVREDFIFGGWYLDAAFTTPAGDTVSAESISVYAKWLVEASPADFSYEINEGKV